MIDITPDGYTIAFISFGLAVMSALVRNAVLDKEKLKEQRAKLKEHQKIIKEAAKSGDTKKSQKAQEEMLKLTMENMKHSFRPMMFTILPFIIVFGWLKKTYAGDIVVATLFGYQLGWFGWYFVNMMIISTILNKIMGVT